MGLYDKEYLCSKLVSLITYKLDLQILDYFQGKILQEEKILNHRIIESFNLFSFKLKMNLNSIRDV